MILTTEALKKHLTELCDLPEDAGDDEVRKAAAGALIDGKLTAEKMAELTKDPDEDEVNEFDRKMTGIADGLEKLVQTMAAKETKEEPKDAKGEDGTDGTKGDKPQTKDVPQPSRMAKMIASMGGVPDETDAKGIDVRVKEAVEGYSTTKTALMYPKETKRGLQHPMAGQRVRDFDRSLDEPSDRDKALAGVWAKFQLACVTPRIAGNAKFAWEALNDHDKSLLAHLAENEKWDDSKDEKLSSCNGYGPGGIKQLIDEAAGSRGREAVPVIFDDMIIQTPLLFGELFPYVNTVVLARGREVEGVQTGTVTGNWGGVDATPIGLFNFNAYITAFDTTIYRWQGACQIGLDFMDDSPLEFGAHITAQYGERLLETLDDVIADGNGTTQPEGVITNGGTAVAFAGANSIGNIESLRFAVSKAEHKGPVANSAVFCGTEESYMRWKALPLAAADARRLFAGNSTNTGTYDDYALMNRPFKVNEELNNTEIFYGIMKRYRMYRRKGLAVRTSTEGQTLMLANEMLITVMARYGGQVERAACFGVTTTAPA